MLPALLQAAAMASVVGVAAAALGDVPHLGSLAGASAGVASKFCDNWAKSYELVPIFQRLPVSTQSAAVEVLVYYIVTLGLDKPQSCWVKAVQLSVRLYKDSPEQEHNGGLCQLSGRAHRTLGDRPHGSRLETMVGRRGPRKCRTESD